MSGKRSRSFKCAVHHRDREVCSENDLRLIGEFGGAAVAGRHRRAHQHQQQPYFRRMVTVIAMEVLPEERDRKYYADNYSCCPPPLFIILITLVEVSFYIIDAVFVMCVVWQKVCVVCGDRVLGCNERLMAICESQLGNVAESSGHGARGWTPIGAIGCAT